ncbi:hypothetical protein KR009_011124 [Drosophila setifemur]|nr:hypothetical protein KR009_011124 [Drosophila setifemur]
MSMAEMMRGKPMPIEQKNDIKLAQHDFANVRITQIGCVVNILAEAIERVKISLILPNLLAHPERMAAVLKGTKFQPAVRLVESFVRRRRFILRQKRPPLMDHGIIQIIDFFQRNYQMYHLFTSYYNHMGEDEKKVLIAFQLLHDLAKERLYQTSADAISLERQLHAKYKKNEVVKEELKQMEKSMKSQREAQRIQNEEEDAHLKAYADMLMKKKNDKNARIQQEIDHCAHVVRARRKESHERQGDLEDQIAKANLNYKTATKTYMKQEKTVREEKNKLILQLQALIKKYDHSIGEKLVENLQLMDESKVAKKNLEEFMVGFRKVERVYKDIVVKREEEEIRKRQHRLIIFAMNRAASKIQKYWRKWKKHMRKKNKRLAK